MRPTVESANGTVTSQTKFLSSDEDMIVPDSPAHHNHLDVDSTSLGTYLTWLFNIYLIWPLQSIQLASKYLPNCSKYLEPKAQRLFIFLINKSPTIANNRSKYLQQLLVINHQWVDFNWI